MGETLRLCYSESSYEHLMYQVEENMKINDQLKQRNETICVNLQKTVDTIGKNVK